MKRHIIIMVAILLLGIGLPVAIKSVRESHYPIPIKPSDTWEPFIQNLDAAHVSITGSKCSARFHPKCNSHLRPKCNTG